METTLRAVDGATTIAECAPQGAPEPRIGLVPPPPPGLRAKSLLQEARRASLEQLSQLEAAIDAARELSDAVVEAGDLHDPGLQELARQLSEALLWKSMTLKLLAQRRRTSLGL
jgi:hypothetical protein